MVELPQRFIVCDQPREISAEFGISCSERSLNQAGESRLVFLCEAGKTSLEAIVKLEGAPAVFGDRANEAEFLLLAGGKDHVKHQHSRVLNAIGHRMKSLGGGDLRVLRLKEETAALCVPCDFVVSFAGRIDEPGTGFSGDGASHIESQSKAALSSIQIFYGNRLRNRPALSWQKQAGCESQTLGGLRAEHTMRTPLIFDIAVGRGGYREEATIQKNLASQEKAGTPGGFGHTAAGVRRKGDRGDGRNGFPGLRVAKLVHRNRAVEQIAQPISQSIRRHVGES